MGLQSIQIYENGFIVTEILSLERKLNEPCY